MPVRIQNYPGSWNPWGFEQTQVLEARGGGPGDLLVLYSGTALVTVPGAATGWNRGVVRFPVPTVNGRKWTSDPNKGAGWTFIPPHMVLDPAPNSVANGALAAIYNKSTAVNAGWAVDAAWVSVQPKGEFNDDFLQFQALVAVSDVDGFIYRLSYQVSVLGRML